MKAQKEKEIMEKQRQKNKQDEFSEMTGKHDYTFDSSGKVMIVKKPKLLSKGDVVPEYEVREEGEEKKKGKRKGDKEEGKVGDEGRLLEVEEKEQVLKDYQGGEIEVGAGVKMVNKEGKQVKGPELERGGNKMTLGEYKKIAKSFEVQAKEENIGKEEKELGYVHEESGESIQIVTGVVMENNLGKHAKIVKTKDVSVLFEGMDTRMMRRKDLKSANVKRVNEEMQKKHNQAVRVASAKNQQDVRVRKVSNIREKVVNYKMDESLILALPLDENDKI